MLVTGEFDDLAHGLLGSWRVTFARIEQTRPELFELSGRVIITCLVVFTVFHEMPFAFLFMRCGHGSFAIHYYCCYVVTQIIKYLSPILQGYPQLLVMLEGSKVCYSNK